MFYLYDFLILIYHWFIWECGFLTKLILIFEDSFTTGSCLSASTLINSSQLLCLPSSSQRDAATTMFHGVCQVMCKISFEFWAKMFIYHLILPEHRCRFLFIMCRNIWAGFFFIAFFQQFLSFVAFALLILFQSTDFLLDLLHSYYGDWSWVPLWLMLSSPGLLWKMYWTVQQKSFSVT